MKTAAPCRSTKCSDSFALPIFRRGFCPMRKGGHAGSHRLRIFSSVCHQPTTSVTINSSFEKGSTAASRDILVKVRGGLLGVVRTCTMRKTGMLAVFRHECTDRLCSECESDNKRSKCGWQREAYTRFSYRLCYSMLALDVSNSSEISWTPCCRLPPPTRGHPNDWRRI